MTMFTKLNLTCILGLLAVSSQIFAQEEVTVLNIYNETLFYDGYLLDNFPEGSNPDDGILRHRTSLYALPLTDAQLDQIGEELTMNIRVKACCDNYDRIGNINLALVPKGENSYDLSTTSRIELGRFITPFMDMNKTPDTVPYTFNVDFLSWILRDVDLRGQYDFWVEFELFGVPYAANSQIKGCKERSDVFYGSLDFVTSSPASQVVDCGVLVPIVIKKPEYQGNNLNNYNEQATDEIGKTEKTYTFVVPENVVDGQILLITSNHGANENGEEYNRRWHYVYVDGELVHSYIPGRTSCEPFRKYNTQLNGIYGYVNVGTPWFPKYDGQNCSRTDEDWQSFSNWCPGDVIDNRIIDLGAFSAGEHKVRISVPDAEFADGQGDIPVSMFFQGVTAGQLPAGIDETVIDPEVGADIVVESGRLVIETDDYVDKVELFDINGMLLYSTVEGLTIPMVGRATGVYLAVVTFANGIIETHKVCYTK